MEKSESMKRLIIGTLSLLTLSSLAATGARAEMPVDYYGTEPMTDGSAVTLESPQLRRTSLDSAMTMEPTTTPFELAYLGYFGVLDEAGIPGYTVLLQDYRQGEVSGERLVEAAVSTGRLDISYLTNEGYIDAVDNFLNSLAQNSMDS